MARGAINVQITGDYTDKDIKRAIKDIESLQSKSAPTAKSMGGITNALKSMAFAAGAFVSVSAIKDFAVDAIQQGSALQESLSKTEAVFGENADAVKAWAKDSATAFGQSQQQALEAAGTFGNLLQAFGVTRNAATDMSQTMTQLAADLASFNNTSIDDAIIALRSGLSGETEPLKRYGIALNDARLKAVALEQGLYSGKGALDVAAKAQAAYTLILKDSTLAQGDFQRTSGGFANQMRIITAQVDNLKASFGIAFIDGLNLADGSLGEIGSSLGDLEPLAEAAGSALGQVASALIDIGSVSADAIVELTKPLEDQAWWAKTLSTLWKIGSTDLSQLGQEASGYNDKLEQLNAASATAARQEMAMADRYRASADALSTVEQATEDAAVAQEDFADSLKATNTAISLVTARIDLQEFFNKLKEELKGSKRVLDGIGPSALENQGLLVNAFSMAAKEAEAWAKKNGASATETRNYYDGLARQIVDNFVDQGFKRKDVMNWLNANDVWGGVTVDIISRAEDRGRIAAHKAGLGIGRDLADGVIQGMAARSNWVNNESARLVINAERAARAAAQTQSPSKVFASIGRDLAAGLAQGIEQGGDKVRQALQKAFITWFQETRGELKAELDAAKGLFNDFAKSVSTSVMSALNFSAIAPEFDEQGNRVGASFMDGLRSQVDQAKTFAERVRTLLAMNLSPAALQMVLDAGVVAGTAIANELIAGGTDTIDQTNALVLSAQQAADEVGAESATKFYGAGVAQAQATYNGFRANFGKGGPARAALMQVMDNLAAAAARDVRIDVAVTRSVNEVVTRVVQEIRRGAVGVEGAGATGAIVRRPTVALIGEAGPEALLPLNRTRGNGPVSDLGVGTTINLTVNAGLGTSGAEVGRQIVDALKAYERRNGAVYVAA